MIRPGLLSTLCTYCDNESAAMLPHLNALCTSFGIQRKPTRVLITNPEVNLMLEINIKHGDAWPADLQWPSQQLLVTVCVPNTTTLSFTQTPSIQYSNPPHEVKQLQTGTCCSAFPLLLTIIEQWRHKANTKVIIQYPLKKLWSQDWWKYWDSKQRYITPHYK